LNLSACKKLRTKTTRPERPQATLDRAESSTRVYIINPAPRTIII